MAELQLREIAGWMDKFCDIRTLVSLTGTCKVLREIPDAVWARVCKRYGAWKLPKCWFKSWRQFAIEYVAKVQVPKLDRLARDVCAFCGEAVPFGPLISIEDGLCPLQWCFATGERQTNFVLASRDTEKPQVYERKLLTKPAENSRVCCPQCLHKHLFSISDSPYIACTLCVAWTKSPLIQLRISRIASYSHQPRMFGFCRGNSTLGLLLPHYKLPWLNSQHQQEFYLCKGCCGYMVASGDGQWCWATNIGDTWRVRT